MTRSGYILAFPFVSEPLEADFQLVLPLGHPLEIAPLCSWEGLEESLGKLI